MEFPHGQEDVAIPPTILSVTKNPNTGAKKTADPGGIRSLVWMTVTTLKDRQYYKVLPSWFDYGFCFSPNNGEGFVSALASFSSFWASVSLSHAFGHPAQQKATF